VIQYARVSADRFPISTSGRSSYDQPRSRIGWGLTTVCGVAGKGETLEIVPRLLITGRRVAGSSFGGVKGRDQVPQFVDRWLTGEIDVEPFVSHKLKLDEVNRGFELMEAQDGIRSVIDFG
jgi:S-(hydroxymethyl)glutathione dehydrogenase/alcohol dehydrogenase